VLTTKRSLHTELKERTEETRVELQSVEESLVRETKGLREELTALQIETYSNKQLTRAKIGAVRNEFQTRQ
jgi:hypothetical protein